MMTEWTFPEAMTLAELERLDVPDPDQWLPWRLDQENTVLWCDRYGNGRSIYEIDLQQCQTSSQVLDWICQVANKSWALDEHAVISGLVIALNDILEPQANLCSWTMGKRLTKPAIKELVSEVGSRN